MLEVKTKIKLAEEAFILAQSFNMVRYRSVTYLPVDYETGVFDPPPDIDRTIWQPQTREKIRRLAANRFDTLFTSDSELSSFDFMVAQSSIHIDKVVDALLVRTPGGLKELDSKGDLVTPSQEFRPNTLVPMLNEDADDKQRILDVIVEWLRSEEEAESLLRHLATCLAPGWSAVKYVLLLGEGRNGKSLMLKMLQGLFGPENVSNVDRQAMSTHSPVVTELNGKLLNLIYDGRAEYVKDSAAEKSLVAGETVKIRRLYESDGTPVQTNALFIEGLQREPKTSDKSTALQKRLVRFAFPNVYDLDHVFERSMLTQESLGALLSLLIDRYVVESRVAGALVATTRSLELQLEQMYTNSIGLQFLKYLEEADALGATGIIGEPMASVVQQFQSWRIKEGDLGTYADPDVQAMFAPLLNTERMSERINGQPRKVRKIVSFKVETTAFIDSLKGTTDEQGVVEEGDV